MCRPTIQMIYDWHRINEFLDLNKMAAIPGETPFWNDASCFISMSYEFWHPENTAKR
jgi:hypothetical protein